MVFQLKIKNKSAKNSISKNIGGFKSILSKVKYVAKNVIYVKKWSSNLEEEKTKKITEEKNINIGNDNLVSLKDIGYSVSRI